MRTYTVTYTIKVSAGVAIATRWHTILGRDFIPTNGPKPRVDLNTPPLEPKCLGCIVMHKCHVTSLASYEHDTDDIPDMNGESKTKKVDSLSGSHGWFLNLARPT